jgi:hypothetical protein
MDGNGQAIQVVNRHNIIDASGQEPAPFSATAAPLRPHQSRAFIVYSEIVLPTITEEGQLKGPPEIHLGWQFKPGFRGTIVGYRSTKGFGKSGDHGEMIVNSRIDDSKPEQLDPGEYFYSFFTRSSILGLVHKFSNEVQFAVTVPNAAGVLAMMRNAISFTQIRQEYVKLTKPAPKTEDSQVLWKRKFDAEKAAMDLRFTALGEFMEQWEAKRKEIEESNLTKAQKKERLDYLDGSMQKSREKLEL